MGDKSVDQRTPKEAERVMNAALKNALSMPPQPHKQPKSQKHKSKKKGEN